MSDDATTANDDYAGGYRKTVNELTEAWIKSMYPESVDGYVRPPCEGPHVHWAVNATEEN